MNELLKTFPVVIQIPVAWGDMDAFEHVNNTVYFRYFESTRIAYFERAGFFELLTETGIGPILAATACKFKAPLTYPDTVSVGTRIVDIEADRFNMLYRVVSHKLERVAAEGEGQIVAYNYRTLKKAPLPATLKQRILEIEQTVTALA